MEKEFQIKLYDVVQTNYPAGRTTEETFVGGDTVRKLIEDNWDKHEKIIVLFDMIAKMTRGFMDEAFAKLLEKYTLEEFNQKVFFPDAKEWVVKDLNSSFKIRLKIIKARLEKEKDELSL